MRIPESPRDQAALVLGLLALISPVFALTTSSNNNFVKMEGISILLFPLIGLLAIVGALTSRAVLATAAGALFALMALVQLAQFGRDPNWLGGSGNTFSLLLALSLGLMLTSRFAPTHSPETPQPRKSHTPHS